MWCAQTQKSQVNNCQVPQRKKKTTKNNQTMRTYLLIALFAACLAISFARYKSSDFTDAGEDCTFSRDKIDYNIYIRIYVTKNIIAYSCLSVERMKVVVPLYKESRK